MFYIYGSHTEDAVECASLEDATNRFRQMLATARRRGDIVIETEEHRWSITPEGKKSYTMWIADSELNTIYFKE